MAKCFSICKTWKLARNELEIYKVNIKRYTAIVSENTDKTIGKYINIVIINTCFISLVFSLIERVLPLYVIKKSYKRLLQQIQHEIFKSCQTQKTKP